MKRFGKREEPDILQRKINKMLLNSEIKRYLKNLELILGHGNLISKFKKLNLRRLKK